jgi:VWFA-related protein
MSRLAKATVLGGFLAMAMLAPVLRAQDTGGDVSSQLPEQPKPAAKPNKFTAPNPYAYSAPEPPPFVPPKIDIEPEPSPVAVRLWPFEEQEREEGRQAGNEIHVYTNEVIAPVTVLDKRGQFVLDLEQKDFHVFDNGVEQRIVHWDLGGDPLAVAVVIETSSHIERMAPVIRGMGSIFTETVMALNGEAAVITFDSTVEVRQPFTKDHDAIQSAVAAVQFEAPEMRLHDAMATAVDLLKAQPPTYRRVMLIVGESQDSASDAKLGLVLREAQLANIAIYGIGVSSSKADLLSTMHASKSDTSDGLGTTGGDFSSRDHRPYVAPSGVAEHAEQQGSFDYMTPAIWLIMLGVNKIKDHQLELAVAATGGVHYHAYRDRTVRSALDEIGGELHAQYVLGYVASTEPANGFHEIRVTVERPEDSVRARPGYYLTAPGDEMDVTGKKKAPAVPVEHFFAAQ